MAFLVDSGNPWEKEAPAICITSAVHKSEMKDRNVKLFLVQKFAEVLENVGSLFEIEVHPFSSNYIFTLYTYGEPLEPDKEKTNDEKSDTKTVKGGD